MIDQTPEAAESPAVTVNIFLHSGRMLTHVNPFASTTDLDRFIGIMNMCGSDDMSGTLVLANPIRVYPVSRIESIEVHATEQTDKKPFGLGPLIAEAENSGKVLTDIDMPVI